MKGASASRIVALGRSSDALFLCAVLFSLSILHRASGQTERAAAAVGLGAALSGAGAQRPSSMEEREAVWDGKWGGLQLNGPINNKGE